MRLFYATLSWLLYMVTPGIRQQSLRGPFATLMEKLLSIQGQELPSTVFFSHQALFCWMSLFFYCDDDISKEWTVLGTQRQAVGPLPSFWEVFRNFCLSLGN
ncbi:hypothetical protein B0H11DRAFT_2067674 [Mycena galericulata]|nr:hypothetical protein B0H11DRAFT_2067674 [Mycena galericulata]